MIKLKNLLDTNSQKTRMKRMFLFWKKIHMKNPTVNIILNEHSSWVYKHNEDVHYPQSLLFNITLESTNVLRAFQHQLSLRILLSFLCIWLFRNEKHFHEFYFSFLFYKWTTNSSHCKELLALIWTVFVAICWWSAALPEIYSPP